MLRIVLFARASPCWIASSKLAFDVELISVTFATLMCMLLDEVWTFSLVSVKHKRGGRGRTCCGRVGAQQPSRRASGPERPDRTRCRLVRHRLADDLPVVRPACHQRRERVLLGRIRR